jgi:hypothetical protein
VTQTTSSPVLDRPVPTITPLFESLRRFEADASARTDSPAVDWEQVRSELIELRPFLDRSRSPAAGPSAVAADDSAVGEMIGQAVAALAPLADATGRTVDVTVAGKLHTIAPPSSLGEATRDLLNAALMSGQGSLTLRVWSEQEGATELLTVEVAGEALDVPDAARRRLTKAVGAVRGQTSFISALGECAARITMPVSTL